MKENPSFFIDIFEFPNLSFSLTEEQGQTPGAY